MGAASGGQRRIAGRVVELSVLDDAVRRMVRGSPSAVLVHGEAGVGKTTLVRAACDVAVDCQVLWGGCLRFGAAATPYQALIGALEGWLSTADPGDRADLIRVAPGLDRYLPSLGGGPSTSGNDAFTVFDAALSRLSRRRPTLLVVDDLQWADVSSLDVLAYLALGIRTERLGVLLTLRDEDIPEGHPLHLWLAELRRLPPVVDLPLGRLSVDETGDLVQGVLGSEPPAELVDEVFSRSQGNAYLAELLVRDLPPGATSLPAPMPDALRSALVARWHGLSAPARVVTRLVAVAGRPVPPAVLEKVGMPDVGSAVAVDQAMHEGVRGGVLQPPQQERVWFRHPLLAEVLLADALPSELAGLHLRFVEALTATGSDDLQTSTDLALHLDGAGRRREAVEQYLRAAAFAAAEGGYPERADLCRRAARSSHSAELWVEAAYASFRAGDFAAAAACAHRARELADRSPDPAEAIRAQLAGLDMDLFNGQPRTTEQPELLKGALDQCEALPAGLQAMVLDKVAQGEFWRGNVEASGSLADRAVAAARRSGDTAALSSTLATRSLTRLARPAEAEEDAEESYRLALARGDPELVMFSAVARCNVREDRGDLPGCAGAYVEACEFLRRRNVIGLMQPLAASAAERLVALGRLAEARDLVRRSLATRPRGTAALLVRLTALQLSLREGRRDEADSHYRRLHELMPDPEQVVGWSFAAVLAEYHIAAGAPERAVQVVHRALAAYGRADPKYRVLMVLLGARATAQLAAAARDAHDARAEAMARATLDRFRTEEAVASAAAGSFVQDPLHSARLAVLEAESERCVDGPRQQRLWDAAVAALDVVGMEYDAAQARIRLAECLLSWRELPAAARVLREANRAAVRMGAGLLTGECAQIARSARISLTEPALAAHAAVKLPGEQLTPREREVLVHLAVGRTYAEIAAALFISEKTVSVHVSNLLRKTGTPNRVSAAAWARRNGMTGGA